MAIEFGSPEAQALLKKDKAVLKKSTGEALEARARLEIATALKDGRARRYVRSAECFLCEISFSGINSEGDEYEEDRGFAEQIAIDAWVEKRVEQLKGGHHGN
jgi:hypothetical protein